MPSTTSSVVSIVLASSTVIVPSFANLSIAVGNDIADGPGLRSRRWSPTWDNLGVLFNLLGLLGDRLTTTATAFSIRA